MTIPVTVVVLTRDEAENIGRCLAPLAWCNDVVVVDSGSRDGTVEVARRARPDVRVFENPFVDFGRQRNWAIDNAAPRHDWILFLDADEFFEPEIEAELRAFVAAPGDNVGAYIAGRNYFLGQWLRRCTYFPSYQFRLLRKGRARFVKEGHGQREERDGPAVYFRSSWRHEPFSKGIEQWIARHNRYSSEEVENLVRLADEPIAWRKLLGGEPVERRRQLKALGARLPARPLIRFAYTYLVRLGFLDGRAGLQYCLLQLAHQIHMSAKLAERRTRR